MSSFSLKQIAPWTRRIIIVNVLIAVMGYLFLAFDQPNPFSTYFALRLGDLMEGKVWQLLTYMWVHADGLIIHILFNMMTLYYMGRVVEYKLGGRPFLLTYLLGGMASVGLFIVDVGIQSQVLGQEIYLNQGLVGASGAVCAIMGAFALIQPEAKLYIMFLPFPVRAVKAVKGFALFSFAAMMAGWVPAIVDSSSLGWLFSIGHSAHLGGILFGWWFIGKRMRSKELSSSADREIKEPELARVEMMDALEIQQAMEPIYDKIATHGMSSLTERERRILDVGRRHFS